MVRESPRDTSACARPEHECSVQPIFSVAQHRVGRPPRDYVNRHNAHRPQPLHYFISLTKPSNISSPATLPPHFLSHPTRSARVDRVFHSASFHDTRLIYRPQCPFCRAKIISFEPIDFSTYKGACKWGSGSSRAVVHALVLGNRETAVQCRISASHHAPLLCTLSVCLSLRVSECVVSVISLFTPSLSSPSLSSNLSPTLSLTQSDVSLPASL